VDIARISALLAPFLEEPLLPSQLEQISTYIDLLLRWNARINLTAIRQEQEIVPRHFGESLFMARHLFAAISPDPKGALSKLRLGGGVGGRAPSTDHRPPTTDHCLLDIGSGAGFPGLPLKIWAPDIHLTMIESNHKKAAFLREVARALTLMNVNVITGRAETLAADPAFPRTQIVTLRAVESFDTILPTAAALTAPTGRLALLIGSAQLPKLAALPDVSWSPPIPVPQSQARVLSIGVRQ
jgi:16S rRNA (guanine527-N7)-methyltransferase